MDPQPSNPSLLHHNMSDAKPTWPHPLPQPCDCPKVYLSHCVPVPLCTCPNVSGLTVYLSHCVPVPMYTCFIVYLSHCEPGTLCTSPNLYLFSMVYLFHGVPVPMCTSFTVHLECTLCTSNITYQCHRCFQAGYHLSNLSQSSQITLCVKSPASGRNAGLTSWSAAPGWKTRWFWPKTFKRSSSAHLLTTRNINCS